RQGRGVLRHPGHRRSLVVRRKRGGPPLFERRDVARRRVTVADTLCADVAGARRTAHALRGRLSQLRDQLQPRKRPREGLSRSARRRRLAAGEALGGVCRLAAVAPTAIRPAVIDSHCHLADETFSAELAAVLARARGAGVERALVILEAGNEQEAAQAGRVQTIWPEV